jgi:maltose alpha-D-glucosyltransferase / alpha-amylase
VGVGNNLSLVDRDGVSTPMQWTPDRNGGFSRCDPARLYAPPVMDPLFGYGAVNVEAQSRSLSSLLSWTKRMIVVRKSSKVLSYGSLSFLRPANRAVFCYVREYQGEVVLCVANLSRSAQAAEIDLSAWRAWTPMEMIGRSEFPSIRNEPYLLTLAPYGFLWFRLVEAPEHREILPIVPEFETLVLTPGKPLLHQARTRTVFERDVLPAYLAHSRWFSDKGADLIRAHVKAVIPLSGRGKSIELAVLAATGTRATADYVMPLAVRWSRFDREREHPNAVAAVRQGPREGTLFDVAAQEEWISVLLDKICTSESVEADGRRLEFRRGERLLREACEVEGPVRAVNTEQSNSTALVGEKLVIKLFRRLAPGINPEIEIGRFLTDVVRFANSPALLGTVELVEDEGRSSLAVVHEFIGNQGEAWTVTSAYLERFVEEQRLLATDDAGQSSELGAYQLLIAQIGLRLAQMQIALASRDDIADFRPDPITEKDVAKWIAGIVARGKRVRDRLAAQRAALAEPDRAMAEQLIDATQDMEGTLRWLVPKGLDARKIRTHGDFHLGQVLIAKDDVFIIDFEGEPNRTIADRRAKAPAARDVAGLVRSVDYSTTAALERAPKSTPEEHDKLALALAVWRDMSAATFVRAYREAMTDARLWPQDPAESDRLLDLFLIEKALYEIEYELSHRPQWLRVPLAGILRILAAHREVQEVPA